MELAGKQVNIAYDDGGKISIKHGAVIDQTPQFITLLSTYTDRTICIPVLRIVRIEVEETREVRV